MLPEVAFSWNFHQNFDSFIHAEFSINQKMESTIILYIENTCIVLDDQQFLFLVGTLLFVLMPFMKSATVGWNWFYITTTIEPRFMELQVMERNHFTGQDCLVRGYASQMY